MSRIVDVLMSRAVFFLIVTFAALYFVYDVGGSLYYGVSVRCWNWPNITITFALVFALYLARQIDPRMRAALHELWLQGAITQSADPRASLQAQILKDRGRKEAGCAVLIMLVMVAAYAWSEGPNLAALKTVLESPAVDDGLKWSLAVGFFGAVGLGIFSGLVVGAFFGRLATYGSMATVLADPRTQLNVRPGHFDGASGLKPVGDFYLYQALLTAIPLAWLAGWALALSWYYSAPCFGEMDPDYIWRMRWQFYGQWLVVAVFTYLGFVRPVLALRRRLKATRAELQKDRIPQIEAEIGRLKETLLQTSAAEAKEALETKIHNLAREHWAIRNMSCWPMDRQTFARYAPIEIATNLAPVLLGPVLSYGEAGQQAGLPVLGGLLSALKAVFQ